jgi:hypothetical protein
MIEAGGESLLLLRWRLRIRPIVDAASYSDPSECANEFGKARG